MNRQEATSIVSYLNRAGLTGAMEGMSAVWADALEDVAYVTAQEVVRDMVRSRTSAQRWVTPGDVIAAVAARRAENLKRLDTPPAPPESIDPDDAAGQIEWTRAYRSAIADGLDEAAADRAACAALGVSRPELAPAPRPVAALVAQVAASLPRVPKGSVHPTRPTTGPQTGAQHLGGESA